jgi:aromatic-amino-acid transaminase
MADAGLTAFVANSFSKSMSLYGERCGALSVVCESADEAALVLGPDEGHRAPQLQQPGHPRRRHRERACSATPALRAAWQADVDGMRTRIQAMRRSLHEVLGAQAARAATSATSSAKQYVTERRTPNSYVLLG